MERIKSGVFAMILGARWGRVFASQFSVLNSSAWSWPNLDREYEIPIAYIISRFRWIHTSWSRRPAVRHAAQREGSALYRDGAGEGQREEAKIGMSRGCVFWFGGFETAWKYAQPRTIFLGVIFGRNRFWLFFSKFGLHKGFRGIKNADWTQ